MPRGSSDIPTLKNKVLQKFVTKFTTPPELILMNLFGESNSPSSTIKWESQTGFRGLAPFGVPGGASERTAPLGIAQHEAEAAEWKEKMPFDEEFLNNLRQEGTTETYLSAERRIARELTSMTARSLRRKEWMFAKMLFNGSFSYDVKGGLKATVDYGITSDHQVTLAADDRWSTGTSRDILGDIMTGKRLINTDCGSKVTHLIISSQVLEYMGHDPDIQTLLQPIAFGRGDLLNSSGINNLALANASIIGGLLDIPNIVVYDEQYEVRAYLTAVVTGSSTTVISVDDASDFETGESLKFTDVSAGTDESQTISSIDVEAGTITVDTAPTASFRAGEDYVTMTRYFVPQNMAVLMASTVENQQIAEFKAAPFGIPRHFGMKADSHDFWDPAVTEVRIQDKGLPILYQRDAVYQLTVAA